MGKCICMKEHGYGKANKELIVFDTFIEKYFIGAVSLNPSPPPWQPLPPFEYEWVFYKPIFSEALHLQKTYFKGYLYETMSSLKDYFHNLKNHTLMQISSLPRTTVTTIGGYWSELRSLWCSTTARNEFLNSSKSMWYRWDGTYTMHIGSPGSAPTICSQSIIERLNWN